MTNARNTAKGARAEQETTDPVTRDFSFVEDTRRKLDEWLQGMTLTAVGLPTELAQTASEKGGTVTRHVTRAFVSPDHVWLRASEIFSDRGTLILNLAAFPVPHSYLPLMQVELIIVRSRVVLAIYDLHDLLAREESLSSPGAPATVCRSLRKRFGADLPQVDERPEWTEGVLSSEALWSRPMTEDALVPSLQALDAFLDACKTASMRSKAAGYPRRADEAAAEVAQCLARVRRQSLEGNPSKRFLETTFGKAWADPFLTDVLYPGFLADANRRPSVG
ncbi:Phycocyanobilin:ferredoxin oxidoreductase [Planctomycetes bacterium Poly30]|uniref:Phycocyanobilin:ferredoxin oxidoreductase n=1 Tax=Saltatorellus ferox TaxID=2528018 RepID=A0A518EKJ1_9BACT|nr:Phycocyanobilin:ferredoxin oxidoreductase [Planctomycetes bacterium Poly30]